MGRVQIANWVVPERDNCRTRLDLQRANILANIRTYVFVLWFEGYMVRVWQQGTTRQEDEREDKTRDNTKASIVCLVSYLVFA